LAIYQRCAANPLDQKSGKIGLARSRQKLGDVLAEMGKTQEAATNYQAGLQLAEAVLAMDNTNADATALRLTCRSRLNLEKVEVVVREIYPQSQALDVGLKPGDVLVRYEGKPVLCSADLPLLTARATGSGIELEIRRDAVLHKLALMPGPLGALCEDRSVVNRN
jgi:S1-C subfamily serine protease